jgi:hypothetical protein
MAREEKNWIAYHASGGDWETFATFSEAARWLRKMQEIEAFNCGGYGEETLEGKDWIARVTHRSTFKETDSKKNYPCPHGVASFCVGGDADACIKDCPDNEPWPYASGIDVVGDVVLDRVDKDINED